MVLAHVAYFWPCAVLCTHHLVNQLTITIIVIDKCQKAYQVTVKKTGQTKQ